MRNGAGAVRSGVVDSLDSSALSGAGVAVGGGVATAATAGPTGSRHGRAHWITVGLTIAIVLAMLRSHLVGGCGSRR